MLCHAITARCRLYDMAIVDIFRLLCVVFSGRLVHSSMEYGAKQMTIRITKVHNPVAAYNRRRPIVEKPRKGKGSYNRKEDDRNASKDNEVSYKKSE